MQSFSLTLNQKITNDDKCVLVNHTPRFVNFLEASWLYKLSQYIKDKEQPKKKKKKIFVVVYFRAMKRKTFFSFILVASFSKSTLQMATSLRN